jgi:thiazole/oxazole-forming peptide maturase SagD family component
VAFCPGFSTGTAAHVTVEKALQNAMLEFIEIDALMLRWYTEMASPLVSIDNLEVAALAPRMLSPDSEYEVLGLDLRVLKGVDAHVFGVAIINKMKESPYITMGAQGGLDPVSVFYRGLMETVAISFLGIYGPLYMPKEYLWEKSSGFTDLDTNVAFFASPERAEEKRAIIDKMISGRSVLSGMKSYDTGDVPADTVRLAQQLASVSEYGVYLDVTAPETSSRGWKVMRVFFPELVSMCVPGVPYSEHPRIKAHGGIRNEYPHPLP